MHLEPLFHSVVADWFEARFGEPTAPQRDGWPAIASGGDTLIAAPTGSGKTLAAFLWSINRLVEQGLQGPLPPGARVIYVSPLKALGNDVERNLEVPLQGIRAEATARGLELPEIWVAVRSGDTPMADRSRMLRHPPHILITTPESFYILLTAEGSRQILSSAETVIVDEIHAVAGDKRGAHLALSLERLDALVGHRVQRVGLSATQRPIDEIAALLVGVERSYQVSAISDRQASALTQCPLPDGEVEAAAGRASQSSPRLCHIVDTGHRREMELSIEIPDQELGPVASHELWAEVFDRIVQQVEAHRTTLVFVNTRRQVERVAHQLGERLGAERVAAHHGSLSRETRLDAEQRLKSGAIPVMVATASLELGIDIGHVDLVCHIGAPRLISTLLQRVGRSGHWLGAIPKGIIYPMTRDDLVQCAAAVRAVRAGELDRINLSRRPRDVLAQQMVATVATGPIAEDDLFGLVRRAYPYEDLERAEFDALVEMLSDGITTGRGRRSAHLHRDLVNHVLRPRRGARLAAITSGGAIPDVADFDVIQEPMGTLVGRVHEDFATESMGGDVFLLGNQSWRIRRVEYGKVRVEDAQGAPPTIPFWLGEAPARSAELSAAVSALREGVEAWLTHGSPPDATAGPAANGQADALSHPAVGRDPYACCHPERNEGSPGEEDDGVGTRFSQPDVSSSQRSFAVAQDDKRRTSFAVAGDDINGAPFIVARDDSSGASFTVAYDDRANQDDGHVDADLGVVPFGAERADGYEGAVAWLGRETGIPRAGAEQIVDYIASTRRILGRVPTQQTIVAERFFDESGGMQLVLHTPFGGRINRAWGLALRKRFCVTFDFELQAAATDDGIVISLGEQHSFPLESVWGMIPLATLQNDLTQAALASPMFTNRWRWNTTRSLSLLRFEGGRRVPMPIQRMRAEDLLAAVFPDQIACQDNRTGPIVPPDHPLVNETIENCLTEAMDVQGLRDILTQIQRGELKTVAVETPLPSLMSHEILNANPYAFLDNAPLEERRARAVALRRVDPDLADGIGALDQQAIDVVRAQAWPDVRDAEELHDALLSLGLLPLDRLGEWRLFADQLVEDRRATVATWLGPDGPRSALVAAERVAIVEATCGSLTLQPPLPPLDGVGSTDADEGARSIVRGWLEASGPITEIDLAQTLGLSSGTAKIALAALEGSGQAMRGNYSRNLAPGEIEWCDRRLLARIHRMTLGRLRQEIEPVSTSDYLRFLLRWQHVAAGTQLHGRDGIAAVIGQLQGLELPAPAWEASVLPTRVARYDPTLLEQLCLSGHIAWGRLSRRLPADDEDTAVTRGPIVVGATRTASGRPLPPRGPVRPRRRQVPGRQAPLAFLLRDDLGCFLSPELGDQFREAADDPGPSAAGLSAGAQEVGAYLARRGASFLADIARGTGRLPAQVEDALWELVTRGYATGDGVAGLRVLLQPDEKRRTVGRHLRALNGGQGPSRLMPVGRWSLWGDLPDDPLPDGERIVRYARQLLQRYGVVFRDVLAREAQAPPWRALVAVFRRLEARGEIRGGRFVTGFVGEQYALPEAVEALRALRRQPKAGEVVLVHCGDPLNLVGILTPGSRVSPYANQVIAYRDGLPVEVGPLGAVQSRLQFAAAT